MHDAKKDLLEKISAEGEGGDSDDTTPAPRDHSTAFIVASVIEIIFAGGLLAFVPLFLSLMYKTQATLNPHTPYRTYSIAALCFTGVVGVFANVYLSTQLIS